MTLVVAGLAPLPGLGLPRLVARFVKPLAPLDPVTTTTLLVKPGDASVVQGSPLTLVASATRLPDPAPVLHWSEDGAAWSQEAMEPAGDKGSAKGFAYAMPAVDKDFRYYVTGGDARSHTFRVTADRRPAVNALRVRYVFPPYAHKPAVTVNTTDGLIEALVGTQATVDVIATEPLKDAWVGVGGATLPTDPTVDPAVRQVKLRVERDAPVKVVLESGRGVRGDGPAGMAVKADPDLPPVVRLIQPAGDLRLAPRDLLDVQYVATDDFGVTGLWLQAQVNLSAERRVSIPVTGDARYQPGVTTFDLATLPDLRIGDLVRLAVVAADGAGHLQSSDVRYVTISPRSIDARAHLRLAEIRQAAGLARDLHDALNDAVRTPDKARGGNADTHDPVALAAVHQSLATADQSAAALRQALLQAVVHGDRPELSTALAKWADDVQVAGSQAQDADGKVESVAQQPARDRLAAAADLVKPLQAQLDQVAQGELAADLLAERQDLQSAKDGGDPRLARYAQRTRDEIAAGAAELKLDANVQDLDAKLNERSQAAAGVLAAQRPVDFAAAAAAWAAELPGLVRREPPLEGRLVVAAKAEAVRPDADLMRARDLQLAGRAAAAVGWAARDQPGRDAAPSTKPTPSANPGPDPPDQFPAAVAAVEKDHALTAAGEAGRPPDEVKATRAAAALARQKLAAWAGAAPDGDATAQDQAMLDQMLAANAAMAKGDYAKAEAADARASAAILQPGTPESAGGKATDSPAATGPSAVAAGDAAPTGVPPQGDASRRAWLPAAGRSRRGRRGRRPSWATSAGSRTN